MDRVLNFINSLNISKDEKIIVACSGGPDSMLLLSLLHDLGYSCVAAHVNHKVRSASDSEYIFLENYCKNNGIIFEGTEITDYVRGNFEDYARNFRYDFFDILLNKYHSNYLFTAHHGDDLIETILMRLVRGSSLKGYAGFSKITNKKNYMIVRPLIYLTKDEILSLNHVKNLNYVIDESNNTDDYTRNRFRHHVLPFLKEEDMLVNERFLEFSEELMDVNNFIESLVYKNKEHMVKDNVIDLNEFSKLDKFMQNKLLRNILSELYPDNLYLVNSRHIEELLKVISSSKPNITMKLPNDITVIKKYDKLEFKTFYKEYEDYDCILKDEVVVPNGVIKYTTESSDTSNFCIRLNSKDVKLPLRVRNKKDGDRIRVKNLDGTKKVSVVFINSKIDQSERDYWPILVDQNDTVLWVPGLKKSNFDIPIHGVYDIILKYEKGEKVNEQEN